MAMFEHRIKDIRKKLLKEKLDAVLVSSVSNINYLSGYANFSKDEREAHILIGQEFAYIITDGRYTEAVKRQAPHLTLFERGHKTPVEKLFKIFAKQIKILGIEEDDLTIAEYEKVRKYFRKTKHFNVNIHRSIKTPDEIKKIEQSVKLGDLAFKFILGKIKAGITEKQLAFEIEFFVKKNGAEMSFPPIVAFGKNSSVPHHHTGDDQRGDAILGREGLIILLDFGVKLNSYCSDMTRTIFLGSPKENQKQMYEVVLEAQQKAVDFLNDKIKSGETIKASDVDKAARDYIISKGYPTIPHSLGHGIGLEVHEHPSLSPKSKEILKEGMVFSIEPGIYLPSKGGVRIEDLFVLERGGLRQITKSPKNIISV